MTKHAKPRGQTEIGDLTRDIFEAAAAVRDLGEQLAQSAGQSLPRWQLLYLLDAQTLTVPTLARRLGLTRQGVQRVADQLIAESLVRTLPNPDHQRSPLHALTPAGAAALSHINKKATQWHEQVLGALSAAEIARGRAFLHAVTDVARRATVTRTRARR